MTITNLDSYKTNKNKQAPGNVALEELPVSQKFCMISGFIMSNTQLFTDISYKSSPDFNHVVFYFSVGTLLGNIDIQILNANRMVIVFRKVSTVDGSKDCKQLIFVDDPSETHLHENQIFQDAEKAIQTLFKMFGMDEKSISLV